VEISTSQTAHGLCALSDCRKRRYRIAPDFGLAARRNNSGIAGYGAAGATPKPSQKTSKQGVFFDRNRLEMPRKRSMFE